MKAKLSWTLLFILAGAAVTECIYWYCNSYCFTHKAQRILEKTSTKGGLVVHLGFGDKKLTEAIHVGYRYFVHGLTPDEKLVEKTRRYIQGKGSYGQVSIEHWDRDYLPYTDNLVNMLVIEHVGNVEPDEIMRVLAPRAVAFVKQGEEWKKKVKPRPEGMDEWTHYLHGPDNNAVARDSIVRPPPHLQWDAPPRWNRSDEYMPSISAIAVGGRIFSIIDKGPALAIAAPASCCHECINESFAGHGEIKVT